MIRSRLVQARGLKLEGVRLVHPDRCVAPRAGAWIETRRAREAHLHRLRSRLVQARGLKRPQIKDCVARTMSRLVQARGLKHLNGQWLITAVSRASCRRVD